ncbi:DUF4920 domain-containing protein [Flavobacterium sp. RHBU_24]|uniref:DUF4920 domain-containing protein n=1 Tax=Flavobacterium sp. RHBU_24 TaxID=3391185 RepID=UPI003984B1C2
MNKILFIAAIAFTATACKKNDTEVKTGDTVIEGKADTVMIDTDTISAMDIKKAEQPGTPQEIKEATEKGEPAKLMANPDVANPAAAGKKVSVAKPEEKAGYASFGDKILADNALTKEQMLNKYKKLKQGDTLNVKFKTKIADVCKKKGCWMALELPGTESAFVRFKDYGFFVPLNATGEEAVVSGKAFVTETSVDELKHYAKDGGKSAAEIAKITAPKVEYGFLADGVLISR